MGRIFGGRNNNSDKSPQFDGLPTGTLQNGTTVIKGDHYEQYLDDYYNSENTEYTSLKDITVETVSPDIIEGIHLGTTEVENAGNFWGMHASSKEFFIETASHIPEVKSALDHGRSLEELKEDPVLGTCASIYFDPKNMPRVEKNDGYYTFDGDGRHRIIIARELGHEIPVRVVGIRTRKPT